MCRQLNTATVMCPKLFLITLLCLCVNAQWDCMTHLGSRGQCVNLDKCDTLNSRLKASKGNSRFFEELKKYNCGYEGNMSKVCCPDTSTDTKALKGKNCNTPNGDLGTCTKLEDCNDIQLNKDFVTNENIEYIKKSTCTAQGFSQLSYVCCKSDPGSQSGTSSPSPPDPYRDDKCVLSAFPPKPSTNCCGVDSTNEPRIIGGNETQIDQFPWLALIEYTRIGYSCGGALISGKYVLTAAHCLVGSKGKDRGAEKVRLGEYDISNPGADCVEVAGGGSDCTYDPISIPIENYVVHEKYDTEEVFKYNDIALIRLTENVKYTDFVRPICLPSTDFTKSTLNTLELYISGWGVSNLTLQQSNNIKLFAKIPYVKKEECNQRYARGGTQSLADTQVCVGGEANRDSCKGDSGGPLMLRKERMHEAVGVISFGVKNCGLENWPSIYTKVYDYLDWINKNIRL